MNLYCIQGKERGQRYPLQLHDAVIIGRDPGKEGLQFLDIMASRQHIKITVQDSHLSVEDLDSANGTRVNGQELTQTLEVYPGDIITMGNTSFVVEDPLHSTSSPDDVARITKQHRTSARLRTQRPTQMMNIISDDQSDTNLGLLTHLLASMPLAVIIFDSENRILVANNTMKDICNIEMGAGQSLQQFFDRFQQQLINPSLLQTLILSSQEQAMALETKDLGTLLAWSSVNSQIKAVYFLNESNLGKA